MIPLASIAAKSLGKRMGKVSTQAQERSGFLNKHLVEIFKNHKLIKIFQKENYENIRADKYLDEAFDVSEQRGLEIAILESFKDYVYVFRNKTIKQDNRNFGNLSLINQMFQRCYLDDKDTDTFFSNLINFL